MAFYDKYHALCQAFGMSDSAVAVHNGLSKASVVKWKRGAMPNGETLQKLARYFGVPIEHFLEDDEEVEPHMAISPQRKIMYSLTDDLNEDQLEKINGMIKLVLGIED